MLTPWALRHPHGRMTSNLHSEAQPNGHRHVAHVVEVDATSKFARNVRKASKCNIMSDTADTANVIIRPPIAWALAVLAGLALQWLLPLRFMPAAVPAGWVGAAVFVIALALFAWAIATITRAGSNVPTNRPTTTIVDAGPYRFTRNPIYLGMFFGLIGLAIAFDCIWLLVALVIFALVIRYGVVAREEAYLERKFGDAYGRYRSRVRRWL
jgi:protein-S-isoprenylcysteine O-methyltransferase Ste14